MLLRPMLASALLTLVAVASLLLAGCSSSGPRDINYGTDVALGYVPPDAAAAVSPADVPLDTHEVSADLTAVADGGAALDSSIDEGS
jgi:hypothetical protein